MIKMPTKTTAYEIDGRRYDTAAEAIGAQATMKIFELLALTQTGQMGNGGPAFSQQVILPHIILEKRSGLRALFDEYERAMRDLT